MKKLLIIGWDENGKAVIPKYRNKSDSTTPRFAETYAQYKKRMDEHLKNKLEELKDKTE